MPGTLDLITRLQVLWSKILSWPLYARRIKTNALSTYSTNPNRDNDTIRQSTDMPLFS